MHKFLTDLSLIITNNLYDFNQKSLQLLQAPSKTQVIKYLNKLNYKITNEIKEAFPNDIIYYSQDIFQTHIKALENNNPYSNLADNEFDNKIEKLKNFNINTEPPFIWYIRYPNLNLLTHNFEDYPIFIINFKLNPKSQKYDIINLIATCPNKDYIISNKEISYFNNHKFNNISIKSHSNINNLFINIPQNLYNYNQQLSQIQYFTYNNLFEAIINLIKSKVDLVIFNKFNNTKTNTLSIAEIKSISYQSIIEFLIQNLNYYQSSLDNQYQIISNHNNINLFKKHLNKN